VHPYGRGDGAEHADGFIVTGKVREGNDCCPAGTESQDLRQRLATTSQLTAIRVQGEEVRSIPTTPTTTSRGLASA
jgi:hypothetical protein